MSAGDSTQLRISDSGEIEAQPLTWDQEPMWSVATVQEGLFERSPFEQMRGQLAIDNSAVDQFNAHWDRVSSPEAIQERAVERAEYEARYEAMMARKRAELEQS